LAVGLVTALLLNGCADFDEPSAVDPTPVLGCYIAPEAPALSVQEEGLRIAEGTDALPFRYVQEKAGMILVIPMVALVNDDGFQIEHGEEHYYRVFWRDGRPFIRVAFAPDGI